jgi:hypothetical protein
MGATSTVRAVLVFFAVSITGARWRHRDAGGRHANLAAHGVEANGIAATTIVVHAGNGRFGKAIITRHTARTFKTRHKVTAIGTRLGAAIPATHALSTCQWSNTFDRCIDIGRIGTVHNVTALAMGATSTVRAVLVFFAVSIAGARRRHRGAGGSRHANLATERVEANGIAATTIVIHAGKRRFGKTAVTSNTARTFKARHRVTAIGTKAIRANCATHALITCHVSNTHDRCKYIGGIEAVYNVTAFAMGATSTIRTVLVALAVRIARAGGRRSLGLCTDLGAHGVKVNDIAASAVVIDTRNRRLGKTIIIINGSFARTLNTSHTVTSIRAHGSTSSAALSNIARQWSDTLNDRIPVGRIETVNVGGTIPSGKTRPLTAILIVGTVVVDGAGTPGGNNRTVAPGSHWTVLTSQLAFENP